MAAKSTSADFNADETKSALTLAAVLKASQALSSEIELEPLVATLVHVVTESAGADRCVLLLLQDDELIVTAVRQMDQSIARPLQPLNASQDVPIALIQSVQRSLEPSVLDPVTQHPTLSADPYMVRQQPQSVLCTPMLHQGTLFGILYLENHVTAGAFTSDRVELLNLLCAQAAISIDNARLYQRSQQALTELSASEARFQKLAANLPGMIYQIHVAPDGAASAPYVSSGCAALYEVPPHEFLTGIRDFRAMEHPDDRSSIAQAMLHSAQTMTPFEHEWRIITPSGTVKWLQAASRPERQADGSIVWDGVQVDISDRKRAEQQLQASQQLLELVLNTIPHKVFWKDRDSNLLGWNRAFAAIIGCSSAAELALKTDDDMPWTAAEADWYRECDRRVMAADQPELGIIETQLQADGKLAWVETSKVPLHDTEGAVIGLLGVYQDITDRKQAEAAQARLIAILEAATDIVGMVDAAGNSTYLNHAGQQLLGIPAEAMNQFHITTVIAPEMREMVQTVALPTAIQKGSWTGESILLTRNNEEIPVSQVIVAHKNEQGEVEFFSMILRDIRDRKQVEAALQKSLQERKYQARLLKTVLDSTRAWIFAKDQNFRYVMVNRSYAEAIGQTVEAILGSDDLELGFPEALVLGDHDKGIRGFRADDRRALAGEMVHNPYDLATTADGSQRIFDTFKSPLYSTTGDVFAMLGFCNDITELKHAETQLQSQKQALEETLQALQRTQSQMVQSEKMSGLGQLVAGVAHEINNPVNFIYGNLTHANGYTNDLLGLLALYQKHYPTPHAEIQNEMEAIDLDFLLEDLPKLLTSMRVGAERIQKIVASLRNFSRMDEAEVKAVNLHDGIDSTLMILQHRLKATPEHPGIKIIKDYGNLPLVECYAGQLNQVFMNILSNAIDALEEYLGQKRDFQPTIIIRTTTSHQQVRMSFADNGSGIPDAIKLKLFDPFFTTKPVGKGTGMGLSISHQIVTEKHGGSLQCLSASGQGTEFIIEIPIQT